MKNEKEKILTPQFEKFKLNRILIKYDFPLLLLMDSPDENKWIFNWCDNNENIEDDTISTKQEITERWMAFPISPTRLENFLSGHISLREIILLNDNNFYLIRTKDFPKPIEIKKTKPEKIPIEYIPKYDITLDGKILKLEDKVKDITLFNMSVHLMSDAIQLGEIPLNISGPFQEYFQRYMQWSSRKIENRNASEMFIPKEYDWTTIIMYLCEEGSYIMYWSCPEKDPAKIKIFQESCQILHDILTTSGKNLDIKQYVDKIGQLSMDNIEVLLHLIADKELSVNLKWMTDNKEEHYLIINKRKANHILKKLNNYNKIHYNTEKSNTVTLSIELTDTEKKLLKKPINGQGGLQSLLKRVRKKLDGNILTLNPYDVDMILRYAQNYGEGGFQIRFRAILSALRRMGVKFSYIK